MELKFLENYLQMKKIVFQNYLFFDYMTRIKIKIYSLLYLQGVI